MLSSPHLFCLFKLPVLTFQSILGDSDHQSVLRVADLVEGTYKFNLTVTNIRDKSSWTLIPLHVRANPFISCLVSLCFLFPVWCVRGS